MEGDWDKCLFEIVNKLLSIGVVSEAPLYWVGGGGGGGASERDFLLSMKTFITHGHLKTGSSSLL